MKRGLLLATLLATPSIAFAQNYTPVPLSTLASQVASRISASNFAGVDLSATLLGSGKTGAQVVASQIADEAAIAMMQTTGSNAVVPTLQANVLSLQAAVSSNATAIASEISTARAAESLRATIASPAFTGLPTAPTQAASDNSSKLATTAYADRSTTTEATRATNAEQTLGNSISSEASRAIGVESGLATQSNLTAEASARSAGDALLAPKASPALTGIPTAPTAAAGDASSKIATTNYADRAVGIENIRATGAEASNASAINTEASRAQNAETLKAPLASPVFTGVPVVPGYEPAAAAAALAPLASPALTGTPTAPTVAAGDTSTKVATTAFVGNSVGTENIRALNAEGALSTAVSNEALRATGVESGLATVQNLAAEATARSAGAALLAPLASPVLTGTPTAPTPSAGDNSFKLATTSYADRGTATEAARALNVEGTNAAAISTEAARAQNQEALRAPLASPVFTGTPTVPGYETTGAAALLAPVASPAFTGIPTAPTASSNTATNQVATTAFVASALIASSAGVSTFNTRSGPITLTSGDVTSALTYTPYNASNPAGYVTTLGAASAAPVQSVAGQTGAVTAAQLAQSSAGQNYGGAILGNAMTGAQVQTLASGALQASTTGPLATQAGSSANAAAVAALGYSPYNAANPAGYINAATAASVAPVQSVASLTGTITPGQLATAAAGQDYSAALLGGYTGTQVSALAVAALPAAQAGASNGVATLSGGKVPVAQLPTGAGGALLLDSNSHVSLTAGVNNGASSLVGSYAQLTGAAGGSFNSYGANELQITSDNLAYTGHNYVSTLDIFHNAGGASMLGSRAGLNVQLNMTATSGNTNNANAEYVGIADYTVCNANDNGTAGLPNAKGECVGFNPIASLGGTYFNELNAEEVDTIMSASGSAAHVYGTFNVKSGTGPQGVYDDAAEIFGSGVNGSTWKTIWQIGGTVTTPPTDSNTTLMRCIPTVATGATCQVRSGIDLTSFSIGSNAFASPGFAVDGQGNLIAHAFVTNQITGPTAPVGSIVVDTPGGGYTAFPSCAIAAPASGITAACSVRGMILSQFFPVSGGTGYAVGNTLSFAAGTYSAVGQITVTQIDNGATGGPGVITGTTGYAAGNYSILPTGNVSPTGGSGTGASFSPTFAVQAISVTNGGNNYTSVPTVTLGTNSVGAAATAHAVLGSSAPITLAAAAGAVVTGGLTVNGPVLAPMSTQASTYTLTATDCGTTIRETSASAVNITVPTGLTTGCNIDVMQAGAGAVTIVAGSGMSKEAATGVSATLSQFTTAQVKVDTLSTYLLKNGGSGNGGASGSASTIQVVTTGSSVTMSASLQDLIIRKTTAPSPTAVTLPQSPVTGQHYTVKDGLGDAQTNNITVSPASGSIDTASSAVLNQPFAATTFVYDGTTWNAE